MKKVLFAALPLLLLTSCASPTTLHNNLVSETDNVYYGIEGYDTEMSLIEDGESTETLNVEFEELEESLVGLDEYMEKNRENFSEGQQIFVTTYDEDFKPVADTFIEVNREFLDEAGDSFNEDDIILSWDEAYDELLNLNDVHYDLVTRINQQANY